MICAKCGMPDGECSMHLFCCNACSHGRSPEAPPSKIARDMLLVEVCRSLEATHPDRAEMLCAALGRWAIDACEECGTEPVRVYSQASACSACMGYKPGEP